MGTFAERYTVSQDAGFQVKAGIAAVRVATQVMTETAATVAWDKKRRALAMTVLSDPVTIAGRFALLLAAQDVPATETDAAVETMVTSLWDSIAGVTAEDRGVV